MCHFFAFSDFIQGWIQNHHSPPPFLPLHSGKLNIAMEHGPFEDVFPIENGDILCYASLPEGTFSWSEFLGNSRPLRFYMKWLLPISLARRRISIVTGWHQEHKFPRHPRNCGFLVEHKPYPSQQKRFPFHPSQKKSFQLPNSFWLVNTVETSLKPNKKT